MRLRINPEEFPPEKGESWWVVHPNNNRCEFRVPSGGMTVCIKDFENFVAGIAYTIISVDEHNGWIAVKGSECVYDMPQYLFARYFDAEVFVVGRVSAEEIEKTQSFNTKAQLESFKG